MLLARRGLWLVVFGVTVLSPLLLGAQAPVSSSASSRAFLDQYCITCHNERLRQSGLMFDRMDVSNVGEAADVWEKVVRKLRAGSMPPEGRPRPDKTVYTSVASSLEAALDRAAASRPDPGRMPAVRRLSRTEYKNAIRDLLGIENLPKGMDLNVVLPADNVRSGFDNLADLLFVSPVVLDGYLAAARNISRLAVGGDNSPSVADTYRLAAELPQERQLVGLPAGTRGGGAIRTYLPSDGEYTITVDTSGASRETHQLEVAVDGDRVGLIPVVRGGTEDAQQLRLPLKAGPRVITATFLQESGALGEETVLYSNRRGGSGLVAGLLVQRLPAVVAVTISGPDNTSGPGDTPSRRRLFVCRPASPADEAPCARQILSALVTRAYRRPATDADLEVLLPFYEENHSAAGFDAGIRSALERVLVSPQFLFRIERTARTTSGGEPVPISDLELASRLSFFVWSSIPDDELLDLAVRGELTKTSVLNQQVGRMLADPRADSFVSNFAAQWLFLRDVEAKRPDVAIFADFDDDLRQAFQRETELFISSVFQENRSVLDLLRADYTFVNERLARHYGMPHVYGSHFRRVPLDAASDRGGLLGQGSILLLTSYPTRTSPVLRGKWVLDNLLGAAPPPPPPNVPSLEEKDSAGESLSMREAMERHRSNPACASCHARMDPVGFALENFDGLGRWRARSESGDPIDAVSTLADGSALNGVRGLRDWLLARSDAFVANLTERLLTYALGRDISYADMPAVRQIVRVAGPDYTFESLVLGVVESYPFQMRRSDTAERAPRAAAMNAPDPASARGVTP
jgi:hypothetical protein